MKRRCYCLAACLLVLGCGRSGHLASVSGTVTIDGHPLSGAVVQFQPVGREGSSSAGITDERGRYELMHTFQERGALRAEHIVTIRTAAVYYDEDDAPDEEPIPSCYNEQSELRRTVQNRSHVFDFALQSSGVNAG